MVQCRGDDSRSIIELYIDEMNINQTECLRQSDVSLRSPGEPIPLLNIVKAFLLLLIGLTLAAVLQLIEFFVACEHSGGDSLLRNLVTSSAELFYLGCLTLKTHTVRTSVRTDFKTINFKIMQ